MKMTPVRTLKSWALCAAALSALCLSLGEAGRAARARTQAAAAGSPEHADEILGVRVGMSVAEALEAVFVNAKRKPGEERPDAKREEGKDVRVVYKKLPQGELQIVFAEGKWVKEITLAYAAKFNFEELRLAPTGSIAAVGIKDNLDSHLQAGGRYDDRYTIGYTSDRKLERFWWRDEMKPEGYRVRVGFVSERIARDGALANKTIARKIVSVTPGDEAAFAKATAAR